MVTDKEFEEQGITEEWEKQGLVCSHEDIDTCDVCNNYGCIQNTNPEKNL